MMLIFLQWDIYILFLSLIPSHYFAKLQRLFELKKGVISLIELNDMHVMVIVQILTNEGPFVSHHGFKFMDEQLLLTVMHMTRQVALCLILKIQCFSDSIYPAVLSGRVGYGQTFLNLLWVWWLSTNQNFLKLSKKHIFWNC